MDSYIRLHQIHKDNCVIRFSYSSSENLKKFFTDVDFVIEYPDMIEKVPDGVAVIPFVCSVLPIIWMTDSTLYLQELDEDFYNSIPCFKSGFEKMYPKSLFMGKISVERIINCRQENQSGAVLFFSGGLDATVTLLRHLDETPDLLALWGSDIRFNNSEGWLPVRKAIEDVGRSFDLNNGFIHTTFRDFDKEGALSSFFRKELTGGWWHDIKHGIGIIGHAAPYVWLKKAKTVYIASSNSKKDKNVTCASHPSIDGFIKFCGASVVHDGFELGRQGKSRYLVDYCQKHPVVSIHLHVCWESSDGNNCCNCEKCFRTMMGFLVEGENPSKFGLPVNKFVLNRIYSTMALQYIWTPTKKEVWKRIQEAALINHKLLRTKDYYRRICWIERYNFDSPEKNINRVLYQKKMVFVDMVKTYFDIIKRKVNNKHLC